MIYALGVRRTEKRIGAGIISTISMSKTMKIRPRRKNRRENGMRAVFLGSNPHSKGEVFSRSSRERDLKIHAAKNVTRTNRREMVRARIRRFIYPKIEYCSLVGS